MKYYLALLAVLSLLLSGCGNNETPETSQTEEPAMESETEAAMGSEEASTSQEEDAGMAEEAAVETASEPMNEAAAPAEEAAAPAAETTTAQADTGKGKQIYDSVCFACHAAGVAGAPKLDDKAAWAPRIAQGMDTMVSHAVNGFQGSSGVMPPKGGRMDLSDEDVAAAVAYMVEQAK